MVQSISFFNKDFPKFFLALFVTLLMATISWCLAGAPGTNGIDDAAITRSYSENLANGHGFVYYVGGERVEGATSFLWTMLLVLPYLFDSNPEVPILIITSLLTATAVFLGFRIAARAAPLINPVAMTFGMAVALLGLPGFFIWSVWSMMEIALWSMLCMLALDRLSLLAEETTYMPRADLWLLIAACGVPLARPEGIAVFIGLCLLAIVVRPKAIKPVGIAIAAALLSFAILTLGRLSYFGFPFPNTYYAKVSVDRLQNIIDGAKYLISFITGHPFIEVLVAGWVILGALSIMALFRGAHAGQRTQILAAALVLGLLSVYVLLGGDHFALWRFYQPIMPIIALPLVIALAWAVGVMRKTGSDVGLFSGLVVTTGLWVGINGLFFYQSRFDVASEYELSHRGEVFGTYLNDFEPRPTMGVVAAGGIALTYEGKMLDLFGLNWVEMAHANPVKVGFRNHASFDAETFWAHQPEILPLYNRTSCQRENWTERSGPADSGVRQLYAQTRFQREYVPIILEMGDGRCTNAFAAKTWLSQVNDARITPVGWDEVTVLTKP